MMATGCDVYLLIPGAHGVWICFRLSVSAVCYYLWRHKGLWRHCGGSAEISELSGCFCVQPLAPYRKREVGLTGVPCRLLSKPLLWVWPRHFGWGRCGRIRLPTRRLRCRRRLPSLRRHRALNRRQYRHRDRRARRGTRRGPPIVEWAESRAQGDVGDHLFFRSYT